jgi:HD-like signal output (HDOD) protein
LESLTELVTIPSVIISILSEIDNENYNVKQIATLIEQDQALTMKVLQVANSPYYGLTKAISTIDLAIVILGDNVIKEILISLLLHQKFFNRVDNSVFDAKSFWQYSMFCGAASRFLARKFKYKLVSEAFVAGLMHDIGLLILMEQFKNNFLKARRLQMNSGYTIIEAEMEVFECTHADVGAWIAEKWNFPDKIVNTLEFHHTPFFIADNEEYADEFILSPKFSDIKYQLASIVSMAEWFSFECGLKTWDEQYTQPPYYVSNEFLMDLVDDEYLKPESALLIVKQGILDEYEKAIQSLTI